jgi:hypothetical protein
MTQQDQKHTPFQYGWSSFESFIYRFWLENLIWDNLEDTESLPEEQPRYLAHYAQKRQENNHIL